MPSAIETLLLAQTAQLAVPVTATPQFTTSTGTSTSGTTETIDTVLGFYQVSLVAGRRYLAVMNSLGCGASVAGDLYALRIRNSGSSSNPTTSSTQIALAQWLGTTAGGGGEETQYLAASFIAPSTGLNTFCFSAQRLAGTGAYTPFSLLGQARELYVMYLGAV